MKFEKALELMKQGKKMKLPSWGGYWVWDNEKETIMIHCRTKDSDDNVDVLDIRATKRIEYTLSNICSEEWIEATKENCTLLGGSPKFDFNTALKYMKRGLMVKRKGMEKLFLNEKGDFIFDTKDSESGRKICLNVEDLEATDWTFAD